MKREGRGGKSRQYPIAPPLAGGRFFFILLAVGLASAILIGRITLLQVIDRPFLQSQGDARTLRHEAIPAHRGMITRAALALILSSASPALAEDVQLAFPLDCTLGQDCHIQQYMDQDPSAAARDYRCSGLTYDGHKGTDFALPDRAALSREVAVRAAAGIRSGV